MTVSLETKSALVTGATRGIGRAIAEQLIAAGASVLATGTKPDGSPPDGCQYRGVDFSDPAALADFAEEVSGGNFDILINNAGINKVSPFAEIDPDDFALIQQVNVTAPFRLCQAVVPGMTQRQWGRIVNISSIWGKISKAHRGAYSASKFAIDGMSASLAAEVAKDGVLVNSVAPGFIDTELTRTNLGADGIASVVAQVPARRLGTVSEVAAFAVWLAGPENTFITGQNIAIDGGFTRV